MARESSATLTFIEAFLKDLSARAALTSAVEMAEQVNRNMNQPLPNERARHLTNLIRRVSRDLGVVVEETDGRKILFGPNVETLPPDISSDALVDLSKNVLDAINKYQRASNRPNKPVKGTSLPQPVQRKNAMQYTIVKETDAFSVRKGNTLISVTRNMELFITEKDGDRQGFLIDFLGKEKA